jgi:hypothetical protein
VAGEGHSGGTVDGFLPGVKREGRSWNWKRTRTRTRRGIVAEGGMREVGICAKKTVTWDGPWQGMEVSCPT